MRLTRFSDIGLRVLIYLAKAGERASPATVAEIGAQFDIPVNHLVKVVHRLAQLEYIVSTKGKGGGIRLAGDPQALKLGDLVRVLEPNMNMVECFDRETNTCRIVSGCQLKHFLFDASQAFIDNLNKHTLADAVRNKDLFRI